MVAIFKTENLSSGVWTNTTPRMGSSSFFLATRWLTLSLRNGRENTAFFNSASCSRNGGGTD